ncbi:hypothetical protein SISSUDRAFT_79907 [Sistotremastrum suecicum HHB10207 ss-3]|uniref:Uncharacterized protein n=1 Tax=Sistotremastrum suecicum HHB10207 ss-3 TaxID=1314776 RepID=A0A166H482_9AGAM|nr:hypothetical protein SISSUDRAFT_79907 [Sistotremastrum suecicum HHB10207 ss-3]
MGYALSCTTTVLKVQWPGISWIAHGSIDHCTRRRTMYDVKTLAELDAFVCLQATSRSTFDINDSLFLAQVLQGNSYIPRTFERSSLTTRSLNWNHACARRRCGAALRLRAQPVLSGSTISHSSLPFLSHYPLSFPVHSCLFLPSAMPRSYHRRRRGRPRELVFILSGERDLEHDH